MKLSKLLLDKIFIPLLLLFLTPIIVGIGSKISTDNWIGWFTTIPKVVWIVLGVILFIWICLILFTRGIKD